MPLSPLQNGLISAFCSFLNFGVYAAFLIAILIAVRPKRPDASGMLVVSASIFLISLVVRYVISFLMPLIADHSGVGLSGIYLYSSISTVLGTILNVVGIACLTVGLIKIANPPNEPRPLHLPPGA